MKLKSLFLLWFFIFTINNLYSQVDKHLLIKAYFNSEGIPYNKKTLIPNFVNGVKVSFLQEIKKDLTEKEPFDNKKYIHLFTSPDNVLNDKILKNPEKTIDWCKSMLVMSDLNDIEKENCKQYLDSLLVNDSIGADIKNYWANIVNTDLISKNEIKSMKEKSDAYSILQLFLSRLSKNDNFIFYRIIEALPVIDLPSSDVTISEFNSNKSNKEDKSKGYNFELIYQIVKKIYEIDFNKIYATKNNDYDNRQLTNSIILLNKINTKDKNDLKLVLEFISNNYYNFNRYCEDFFSKNVHIDDATGESLKGKNIFYNFYEGVVLKKLTENNFENLKNPFSEYDNTKPKTISLEYYYKNIFENKFKTDKYIQIEVDVKTNNYCLEDKVELGVRYNNELPFFMPFSKNSEFVRKAYDKEGEGFFIENKNDNQLLTKEQKMNLSLKQLGEYENKLKKIESQNLENELYLKNTEYFLSNFIEIDVFKKVFNDLDLSNSLVLDSKLDLFIQNMKHNDDGLNKYLITKCGLEETQIKKMYSYLFRENEIFEALDKIEKGIYLKFIWQYYNEINIKHKEAKNLFDSSLLNYLNKEASSISKGRTLESFIATFDNLFIINQTKNGKNINLGGDLFYMPAGGLFKGISSLGISSGNNTQLVTNVNINGSSIQTVSTGKIQKNKNGSYVFVSNNGVFNLIFVKSECGNSYLNIEGTGKNAPIRTSFNFNNYLE